MFQVWEGVVLGLHCFSICIAVGTMAPFAVSYLIVGESLTLIYSAIAFDAIPTSEDDVEGFEERYSSLLSQVRRDHAFIVSLP